jgi:hypothetical protein
MNSKIGPTPPNAPDVGTHLKDKSLDDESQGKQKRQQGQKRQKFYRLCLFCFRLFNHLPNHRGKCIQTSVNARKILKAIVSLSLLLNCLIAPSIARSGATQSTPQAAPNQPGEVYAGIELTTEWARAIALRVSRNEDESGLKLIYSENIRLALARDGDGHITLQSAKEAAQTVLKLLTRLRQQSQAPPDHVFLIGGSVLGAERPDALVKTISEATGKSLTFLDSDTEIQLSVAGAIPRLWKVGDAQIDNRNSSVLIEINGDRTLGGYQLLKYPPNAAPRYDFVTMSVPNGFFGDESFRQALRRERESKPGLVNRKRVYLTGSVPWAITTLIYPEDQQPFVPLTSDVIDWFAGKVARAPREVLNPNLSFIRDRDLRQKAESELQIVKSAFPPQQLAAGVENLRAVASEFEWQGKQIWFARFGHLGRLLSYVRLQAEK